MDCREKILSENFIDLITYFRLPEEETDGNSLYCFLPVNDRFGVIYYDKEYLPPLAVSTYYYRYLPRLYGLIDDFSPEAVSGGFDAQALIKSGISEIQRPPLSLNGRGVVIGFVDTGECVILLLSPQTI